jgi:hypothetical protein
MPSIEFVAQSISYNVGSKLDSYNSASPSNSNNLQDLYALNQESPDKCFQLEGDFDDEIDVEDQETDEEVKFRKFSSFTN